MARNLFTAILERQDDGYVALCPELDIVSQGKTVGEATANLKEEVELFLETADHAEIRRRLHYRILVTTFEARHE